MKDEFETDEKGQCSRQVCKDPVAEIQKAEYKVQGTEENPEATMDRDWSQTTSASWSISSERGETSEYFNQELSGKMYQSTSKLKVSVTSN